MKKIFFLVIFDFLFAISIPNNFSANFVQTITSDGKKLTYKGEIFFKKPNILWKYTYPNEKYIWVKNKVYIYEPDLYQVTIAKKPDFILTKILKKAKKFKKNIYKTKLKDKTVFFIYNKTLQKLWYKDNLGNLVTIKFLNQKEKKISPKLFIPKYPKDVDIIYQR